MKRKGCEGKYKEGEHCKKAVGAQGAQAQGLAYRSLNTASMATRKYFGLFLINKGFAARSSEYLGCDCRAMNFVFWSASAGILRRTTEIAY